MCQRALTRKQTLGSWFERRAAYSSNCSEVLPLRASARAATPSEQRSLDERLRARERRRRKQVLRVSMGADTKANTRELVRTPGGLLQRAQRRVTLEALRESSSSFGTEVILSQTASTGTEVGAVSVVSMRADTKANALGLL